MKKKKLSEIAVNAATLGGKNPSFYDHTPYGIGTFVNAPSVTDYNNESLKTGIYNTLSGALNKPVGVSAGHLIHIATRVDLASQFLIEYGGQAIFHRRKMSNVWTDWFKLTP